MSRRNKRLTREKILVCEGPAEMQGQEITLEYEAKEAEAGLTEYGRFIHLADEGREPFLAALSFMLAENSFLALEVICRGNNWQKIACALAGIFHGAEHISRQIDLRVLKARGYDRLRGMVATCVAGIRANDLRLPDGYDRLANRLFTSQGLPVP